MPRKSHRQRYWTSWRPRWRSRLARASTLLVLALPLATYAWWVSGTESLSKSEAIRRGDELAGKNQPLQAAAAYRIAVAHDPDDGQVRIKLAKAYEAGGRGSEATKEAVLAADLLPSDLDAQRFAVTRLLGSRQFLEAKTRASRLRQSYAEDPQVLVLWGNAISRFQDSLWSLYTLPGRVRSADNFEAVRRDLRKDIPESDDAEAGAAFRQARRLAPTAWDVQLALVNFLWATGRPDEAEEMLRDLANRSPRHAVVNYALATFYRWHGRDADAEPYLKNAAATGPYGRNARLALADFYLAAKRDEEALALLLSMPESDDDANGVSLRAAPIEFRLNRREAALNRIENVLKRDPHNPQAVLFKAQFLFGLGRADESLIVARQAVAAAPRSGEAHAALGQALLATGDLADAFDEYAEAARLSPMAAQPQAQMARLSLDLGRDKAALEYARDAARRFPGDRDTGVMLVEALIRNRDLSTAEFALRPLVANFPDSPNVVVQVGALQAARGEARAARASFVKALEHEPHLFSALSGVVALDLQEHSLAAARQRVDAAVAVRPDDPKYLLLAARVYSADNDAPKAESTLRRVIAVDPLNVDGARALADCLAAQRHEAEAKQVLEQLAQRLPRSTAAQTSLGLLLERIGDVPGARTLYDRIVVQDPRAAIASQRLAAIYVNLNTNLDVALDLAKVALQEQPRDPAASDLLGWIYVQKGLTVNALPLLEDAVRTAPDTAMYRYHLGAAHLKSGNRDKARTELTRAVAIDPNLREARAALAQLGT